MEDGAGKEGGSDQYDSLELIYVRLKILDVAAGVFLCNGAFLLAVWLLFYLFAEPGPDDLLIRQVE